METALAPQAPADPLGDPNRDLLPLAEWLRRHSFSPMQGLVLALKGDFPNVVEIAGEVMVTRRDSFDWRARHSAEARLRLVAGEPR